MFKDQDPVFILVLLGRAINVLLSCLSNIILWFLLAFWVYVLWLICSQVNPDCEEESQESRSSVSSFISVKQLSFLCTVLCRYTVCVLADYLCFWFQVADFSPFNFQVLSDLLSYKAYIASSSWTKFKIKACPFRTVPHNSFRIALCILYRMCLWSLQLCLMLLLV